MTKLLKSALWINYSKEFKVLWDDLYDMRDNQPPDMSFRDYEKVSVLAGKMISALHELQSALATVQSILFFVVGGIIGSWLFN